MPDHLHLLVLGSDRGSLIRFAQHFKQATGFRHRGLWQRSYYDHLMRREETVADVANYIWDNPVRAGLVDDALSYPYSGPRDVLEGEAGLTAEDRAETEPALSVAEGSLQVQQAPASR